MARIDSYNQKTTLNGTEELLGFDTTSEPAINIDVDDLATYVLSTVTLGTAASRNITDFATAAQGTLADSAIQQSDLDTVLATKLNVPTGQSETVVPVVTSAGVQTTVTLASLMNTMMTMGAGDVTQSGNNTFTGTNTFNGTVDGTGFSSAVNSLITSELAFPSAGSSNQVYELQIDTAGDHSWVIAMGGGGSTVVIDTALDANSVNAVENRIVTQAITDVRATKQDTIGGFTNTQDTITERLFGEASAPRTLFNVDTADTTRLVGSTFEWMGTTYTVTMGSANAGQVTFTPTLQDTIPDDTMIQFVFQTWTSNFTGTVDVDTLRFAGGSSMTRALTIDTTLSATSTNALENRAISAGFDTKQDIINTYSENYLGPIEITAQFPSAAGSNQINHSQSVNAPVNSVFTFMGTNYTVTSSTEFSVTFTPNLADAVPQLTRITLNRKNTASINADLTVTDTVNNLVVTPTGMRFPDDTMQTTAGASVLNANTWTGTQTFDAGANVGTYTVTTSLGGGVVVVSPNPGGVVNAGDFFFHNGTRYTVSADLSGNEDIVQFTPADTIAANTVLQILRPANPSIQVNSIRFGANDANLLDDYEEGTWTPAQDNTSVTATFTNATYQRVGNTVTLLFEVNAARTSGTEIDLNVTGIPFTINGTVAGASSSFAGAMGVTNPLQGTNSVRVTARTSTTGVDNWVVVTYQTND